MTLISYVFVSIKTVLPTFNASVHFTFTKANSVVVVFSFNV